MTYAVADLPLVDFTHDDAVSGRLPALQAALALEYGPIYRWRMERGPGAGEYVYLVGPEANRFVFHTGREHFSHAHGWGPIISRSLGKGLLNMDAPEHTRHRKLWNGAFTLPLIEAYLPLLEHVVAERIATWPAQGEVDVYREAQQITFAAVARALAGFAPGPQLAELAQLFFQRSASAQRDQILRRLVALRRKQRDEPARDVLGLIVRARDDDGRPLTDAQIVAHINILLVAGYETTTVLSAWMLYLLATQHTERERVEGELAALLGDAAQPVTIEALRAMRQLDLFIKEAARLYSPLIALPRGVVQPVEWNGYTLPVGTRVRLALAAGHRLPHVFADPERFDPQRFAPPREEERRTPYGFVPFGGGARLCIGINFATLELKVIAALVLRYYHLAAAPDQQPTHAGHVTATIPQGIRLRVARK